ncbi:prenyltransferase/squalene oxidase repeat-containing protein [Streptomyces sp. P9(2023)]|uniref:prenyltransferase/squalene oxidase repeat-containing protein n=1 Tax=Streptomyces sp. P9(2023) TaxID=3064394 RepID=UPI0028F40572|nr:prenyltransferase/squalene oxidase repeat-containing protein [Streptomyces sp. P9(2023)]MDT9693087.1 prenyltransferase/squalene oxidase repeat-containing protein [Streptomyces sp. P9(2023)]
MTTVRRGAAAFAAAAVLCTGFAPVASAAPSPSTSTTPAPPAVPAGLYGTKDPTYDGVWRQSLAFIAQTTSNMQPADEAVAWLTKQQCATGAFASFRPDPAKACDQATMLDTNATAVAVQALTGVKRASTDPEPLAKAAEAGASWLKSVQNKDGGWGYNPGSPSDANSTSIVLSALTALGQKPGEVRSAEGKTPYDALLGLAVPCSAEDGPGAFAYQPDKDGKLLANADATAAATLAGLGKGITARGVNPQQTPTCTDSAKRTMDRAALNGASYLATALAKTGHLNTPPMPGATDPTELPDHGNTADAVVALAAAGATQEAAGALRWLQQNSVAWAKESGPAAYAQLILAAKAMHVDPRAFGSTDLLQELAATGPAPKAVPSAAPQASDDDSGSFDLWWIIGIGMVVGVGIGFLLSGRRK